MTSCKVLILRDRVPRRCSITAVAAEQSCEISEYSLTSVLGNVDFSAFQIILLDVARVTNAVLDLCRSIQTKSAPPILLLLANRGNAARHHREQSAKPLASDRNPRAASRRPGKPVSRGDASATHVAGLVLGERTIDFGGRTVQASQGALRLTPAEMSVLEILAANLNKTVSSHELVERLWGKEGHKGVHSLRHLIRRLRNKIESAPSTPRFILTEPAIGYRLQLDEGDV